MKRCRHDAGWYIPAAELMASSDGDELTIMRTLEPASRNDKVLARCNGGCGATRNVYLKSVVFSFGRIKQPPPEVER